MSQPRIAKWSEAALGFERGIRMPSSIGSEGCALNEIQRWLIRSGLSSEYQARSELLPRDTQAETCVVSLTARLVLHLTKVDSCFSSE